MNAWYQTLNRPPLTPPSWVFSPVWIVLYVMVAVAIILYVRRSFHDRPYRVYSLIALHVLANFIWTGIFFGLRNPGWALLDLLLIDVSLILLVVAFRRYSKAASILLWPYLAWVLFATYLNAGFYLLN
ncbi:MAG: TspO/MBR family protein [Desulfovibrionales bacterium]